MRGRNEALRIWSIAAAVTAALFRPPVARADLRVHAEGGGAAPIDSVLRGVGAGFQAGAAIDYEVVSLLSVGVFYSFGYFLREGVAGTPVDSLAADPRPVLDHAVGGRLGLRLVRHRTAGWFGADRGNLYGEAFLELDLAYHNMGLDHRVGWGFGLGYRVLVAGPFGLGPVFRFRHVVAHEPLAGEDEVVHQLYCSFGITLFLSFDVAGSRRATAEQGQSETEEAGEDEQPAHGERRGEWEEFEASSGSSE